MKGGRSISNTSVIKRNKVHVLPIFIKCNEINLDTYQFVISSDVLDMTIAPIIKDEKLKTSLHPLFRPFDKLLSEGNPDLGKIQFYFLKHPDYTIPACLCSLVLTSNNRLSIFPGWGDGKLEKLSDELGEKSEISHITVEKKNSGSVSIHLSPPKISNKKEKPFPSKTSQLKNDYGNHIGTLAINDIRHLDMLGIVTRKIPKDPVKRFSPEELETIMENALFMEHPLITIPQDIKWNNTNHLDISFTLIKGKLDNVDYPDLWSNNFKNKTIREFLTPLTEDWHVRLAMTSIDRKLSKSFQWMTR